MRGLKIGYWPLTKSMNSAGDRRRLIFWARARGHSIITDFTQNIDVLVASENSDFNAQVFKQKNIPVIFDLVDAYLSPLNAYDDMARGLAKRISGQISGAIKPFSHHVRDFCAISDAVICSSVEQQELIRSHNTNTHVILDSHDEIPLLPPREHRLDVSSERRILWEGQPATIGGVKNISEVLANLSITSNVRFDFVTDLKYFQYLNKYLKRDTLRILKKDLQQVGEFIDIVPWTPLNLVETAKKSSVAMIPIDLTVPMQRLKPENRLLIMWRLGIPCLTSPSPAYVRVSQQVGVTATCNSSQDWFEGFNRLLNDPAYAAREIEAAQNYLSENHNQTILLSKWDRVFESVLG